MKTLTLLFVSLLTSVTTFAQISESEKQTLLDLYHSTNGSSWNTSWNLEAPVTTWHGVTIHENKVVAIDLGFNNLTGTIPASIGNLSHLESLKLFFNQIEGTLPSEIGNLTQLKVLDLNSNNLIGEIPSSIGNLSNLNTLLLSSNQLSGMLPKELSLLTNLTSLVVFDNQLSGNIPLSYNQLKNMSELVIAENNFSNTNLYIPTEMLTSVGTPMIFNEIKTFDNTEISTIVLDEDN
ncbi:MAG: Two component regulator three Y domain protein [Flavobacteriaceae bacterium CG_4_8_14_3_um_filter_34_10]|nr:Two component regulator three Y domain protein [Flavobacteriia bacterium]PIQ18981.1 MAG: Two component regulator three Y domain protein [Flavobacteriaceae bacterium CG18_big_fil_WC_8_21_14_2_50_34_36]PIV49469.1 MAG: Two component regulator three Y domain protein [Flavobacteriaceae bacterium CG02_land_8_20_14_3_00_34_13]PIX10733.1 MAG: Two component regulator three Y domain protein [Flavobacteriaceae bacterium CG_4_8_14_3_um_filter_34_10]PIZ08247.1 MAG: Two component regulator three Y domain 